MSRDADRAQRQSSRSARRAFLARGVSAIGATAAALAAAAARAAEGPLPRGAGYGPLSPVDDQTTGLALLKLPRGFRYASFGWTGDAMDDGRRTPPNHDGMAVVRQDGDRVTLVRNHEITADSEPFADASASYDPRAGGGTVNLVWNTSTLKLERSWPSLSGTCRNCAGGPTPWGTWLTCEEAAFGPGDFNLDKLRLIPLHFEKPHGWVFETPAEGAADPTPIEDMGRFVHEAVAVDPVTGYVYETEDHPTAGFYRYRPHEKGRLAAGGRLDMLRAVGGDSLVAGVKVGATFDVEWAPIDDPTRAHATALFDCHGVHMQGRQRGGTQFARLEGCWYADGKVYFVSTSGGEAACGQVWELDLRAGRLRLVFESPSREVLDQPDNVVVSPRGGLVLCEDGNLPVQRLQGLSRDGQLFPLAENHVQLAGERNGIRGDYRAQEWAGATFSHDGRWLFANLQDPGITVAITGPWESGPL